MANIFLREIRKYQEAAGDRQKCFSELWEASDCLNLIELIESADIC